MEAHMNSAVIDIETTSLAAVGSGIILCVCVRPAETGRTRTFRLDQYDFNKSEKFGLVEREETQLLKDVLDEISKYSVLIGHNLTNFDVPYLKSRAFQRELRFFPITVYDTLKAFRRTGYLTVPNGYGKPSGGMDMVADFLNVRQLKTKIYPQSWWDSVWGNKVKRIEALNDIVDHCQRDVILNYKIFPYLWSADPSPALKKVY